MLMKLHHFSRVGNKTIGQLRHMHQSVLMNTHINKSTELGDIGNNTWQKHARNQVGNGMHTLVEGKFFEVFTWVAPWFL